MTLQAGLKGLAPTNMEVQNTNLWITTHKDWIIFMSEHIYVSKFSKWFNDRLPLLTFDHLINYPTPKNLNYWWTFGGILTFCLVTKSLQDLF